MSQRALLLAVRERLRLAVRDGGLGFRDSQCDITSGGVPPPNCGELFVAIHEGDWYNDEDENDVEVMGFDVTVTVRAGKVTRDRSFHLLVEDAGKNLSQHCRRIKRVLHFDYWTLNRANALIQVEEGAIAQLDGSVARPPYNGFVETQQFMSADRAVDCYLEWFSAPLPEVKEGELLPPVGLYRTLHFGKARRVQALGGNE